MSIGQVVSSLVGGDVVRVAAAETATDDSPSALVGKVNADANESLEERVDNGGDRDRLADTAGGDLVFTCGPSVLLKGSPALVAKDSALPGSAGRACLSGEMETLPEARNLSKTCGTVLSGEVAPVSNARRLPCASLL